MNNLKKEFIDGVAWGMIEKSAVLGVGFFVTLFLARRLTPGDYGLIGMLTLFTALASVLVEGGFGHALIQKKDTRPVDYTTVFYFNLAVSLAVYALLYGAAPYIADFYRQPRLTAIARMTFLVIPLNSLALIQYTRLNKELQMKKISLVTVVASVSSGSFGVLMACLGFGVWALVGQTLMLYTVRTTSLWIIGKWRPVAQFRFSVIRNIFRFSVSLLGVHTLAALFNNIYTLIIGRIFNVTDVGYFNQAQRIESIPSGTLNQVLLGVAFPTLSRLQDDEPRFRHTYHRIMNFAMFINLPVMLALAVISPSLFTVLLTDKWLPSVPLFQLLCIASSLFPLHMINVVVLKAKGMGKTYFRLELFKRTLMVLFILITIRISMYALLAGSIAATIISVAVNMHICGRVIHSTVWQQLRALWPVTLSTLVMLAAMIPVARLSLSPLAQLATQLALGSIAYLSMAAIFKIPELFEIIRITTGYIRKLKTLKQ